MRGEDPVKTARNLARSFGQPVHGLTEEEGYTIFSGEEKIRYIAVGEITGYVSTTWKHFSATLAEGIQNARPLAAGLDADLATAIDLYLASFYEASIRARLLTLITCLEVLAPETVRHGTAVQALSEFNRQIEAKLALATDIDERDALEALLREIDFKKETSIRRRVRHLVLSEAPLAENDRAGLARKVVKAYDLRGAVVHAGAADLQALDEAHVTVLKTVKLLLRARLGLARQPPDGPAMDA